MNIQDHIINYVDIYRTVRNLSSIHHSEFPPMERTAFRIFPEIRDNVGNIITPDSIHVFRDEFGEKGHGKLIGVVNLDEYYHGHPDLDNYKEMVGYDGYDLRSYQKGGDMSLVPNKADQDKIVQALMADEKTLKKERMVDDIMNTLNSRPKGESPMQKIIKIVCEEIDGIHIKNPEDPAIITHFLVDSFYAAEILGNSQGYVDEWIEFTMINMQERFEEVGIGTDEFTHTVLIKIVGARQSSDFYNRLTQEGYTAYYFSVAKYTE